jgi:hypothetical protein
MEKGSAYALALAGIGGTIQAIGGLKSGNAAERQGLAQQAASQDEAGLADYNAAVAELQAADAIARGTEDEQRFRSRVRGAIGAQRAGFAASNIDVNYGTAVDVQADAAFLGELDALTIRSNAAREAWGFKVQGENFTRAGQISRKEGAAFAEAGRANKTASRWGVVSSIVGTAGSMLAAKYGFGG